MANPLKILAALTASQGLDVSSGNLTIGGSLVATAASISASFTTPAAVTGALSGYATQAQVTGAVSNFPSRSEVTGAVSNFATRGEVTGALGNYALSSNISSSFVSKDGSGNVTIAGNLTVRGTTTSVDSTTVNIGDKNINLGTGSSDLAVLSGGGIDLGTNAEVQWRYDNGNTAWTSNKSVNLSASQEFKIGGSSVLSSTTLGSGVTASSLTSVGTITSLTASALNVTGLAKLDGNVNLGNASSDIITAAGQLTASEGVAVASGKSISLGGVKALGTGSVEHPNLGATNAVIVSYNGEGLGSYVSVASASSGPAPGTFVDISSSLGTLVRGTGIEGQLGGVTIIGGAGGVEVAGEGAGINDINISSANGGIKLYAGSNSYGVYISSPTNTSGTLVDGALNIKSDQSYTYITKRTDLGFDTINISGALKQLDSAISSNSGVTSGAYYSVRSVTYGTKQAGNDTIVFFLSGTSTSNQNGRTPTGSAALLSAAGSGDFKTNIRNATFDVMVSTDSENATWTNDLVAVSVTASLQGGVYFPLVTIDAPALSTGNVVRLVVVNEKASVI
jgi:hypothetical protein